MLNSHKISTPGSSSISGSGSCVYLRPEQNIPEVFANPGNSVFKPIDEVDGNNSDVNDNNDLAGNSNRSETTGAISRDDIVVTMRSVNVWRKKFVKSFFKNKKCVQLSLLKTHIHASSI